MENFFNQEEDLFDKIDSEREVNNTETPEVQPEQPKRGRPKKQTAEVNKEATEVKNEEVTTEDTKEEQNLFELIDNEAEENTVELKKGKESNNELGIYTSTVENLKNLGIFDFELEEGVNLDENLAKEIIEDQFDGFIDDRVKVLFEDLPEDLKTMNKYVLNGGRLEDILNMISEKKLDTDLDLDLIENQERIVKAMLKRNNKYLSDENIQTQVEMLRDAGKLYDIATAELNGLKEEEELRKQQILEEQERAYKERKEQIRKAKQEVLEYVSKNSEIGGLRFKKGDREKLPTYIHDKTVKLQDGNLITEFEKDLFYEVLNNKTAMLQLATLLKHRNQDGSFNFDSIYKQAQTDATRDLQNIVRRKNDGGTATPKYRRLEDFFN